jgi:8-oxo-dGTP diphosphatase
MGRLGLVRRGDDARAWGVQRARWAGGALQRRIFHRHQRRTAGVGLRRLGMDQSCRRHSRGCSRSRRFERRCLGAHLGSDRGECEHDHPTRIPLGLPHLVGRDHRIGCVRDLRIDRARQRNRGRRLIHHAGRSSPLPQSTDQPAATSLATMIRCQFEHNNAPVASLRHATADVIALDASNRVLLVRRAAHLGEGGKWCLPGGYLDRNEFVVDGGRRELLEETGFQAGELKLLTVISDPGRPGDDRQNVAFIFFGHVTEQVGEPDQEAAELGWFTLDELPAGEEMAFDHFHMLQLFRSYREGRLVIPHIA